MRAHSLGFILLTGMLLYSCRSSHHVNEYTQAPSWKKQNPWNSESLAQKEWGYWLARHWQQTKDHRSPAFQPHTICADQIHWDSTFSFVQYQPAEWGDYPAYLDVQFSNGQTIRAIWAAQGWIIEPLNIGPENLEIACDKCPRLESVQRKNLICQRISRGEKPGDHLPGYHEKFRPDSHIYHPQDFYTLKNHHLLRNPREVQEDAVNVFGRFWAHLMDSLYLQAEDPTFQIAHPELIQWDHSFTVMDYQVASSKNKPTFLIIRLGNGQRLRIIWGRSPLGWIIEPLGVAPR